MILIYEGSKKFDLLKEIQHLQTLSAYEIPKEIYFLENFIETETNKIDRIKTLGLCKID